MSISIRADELKNALPAGCIILDVRTAMEHAEKHIGRDHAHVPLDALDPVTFMQQHGLGRDARVYILCRSGGRAAQAAAKFMEAGYPNATVIEGGIMACESCGHAIKTGPAPAQLSLERQVRIAAGLLAGGGALLGLLAHPLFTLIPLFVGGGLVFAGITDRCGMALLLAKAPWNKMQNLV